MCLCYRGRQWDEVCVCVTGEDSGMKCVFVLQGKAVG